MSNLPKQTSNNKVFLGIMSILASIQVIAGGITLIDAIPADVAGILILIVGAVQVGVTYYLNGQIVPLDKVVAYQPSKFGNTNLYAGGASVEATGSRLSVDSPVGIYAGEEIGLDEAGHGENG